VLFKIRFFNFAFSVSNAAILQQLAQLIHQKAL